MTIMMTITRYPNLNRTLRPHSSLVISPRFIANHPRY